MNRIILGTMAISKGNIGGPENNDNEIAKAILEIFNK